MSDNLPVPEPKGTFLFYQTDDGTTKLQVRVEDNTVWLTQRMIAELFQVSIKTANEHLVNIYAERELDSAATIRNFRIVQLEGNRQVERQIDHYNLDAILAVGYRVRSARGTQFRQWATAQLRELLVTGFVAVKSNVGWQEKGDVYGACSARNMRGLGDGSPWSVAAVVRGPLHGKRYNIRDFSQFERPIGKWASRNRWLLGASETLTLREVANSCPNP